MEKEREREKKKDEVINNTGNKKLPDKPEFSAKVVEKQYGRFYLCIPKKIERYKRLSQNKVIAFDSGIKFFCTGYDLDEVIVEVVKSNIPEICHHYDKLQSKWSQKEVEYCKRCKRARQKTQH